MTLKQINETDGWIIFNIEGLGINRERKSQVSGRTLWIKISNPAENNTLFAYQRYTGAGPQPEGTLASIEIEDILVHLGKLADSALDRMEQAEEEKKENW